MSGRFSNFSQITGLGASKCQKQNSSLISGPLCFQDGDLPKPEWGALHPCVAESPKVPIIPDSHKIFIIS